MSTVHRLKQVARHAVRAVHKLNKNRLEIVLYHSVMERANLFTTSGHNVHPDEFEKQIKYLQTNYEIISLEEASSRARAEKQGSKPVACVCFDDGYSSNLTEAYPILQRLGVPATIFICGSVAGNVDLLWRDKIRYLIYHGLEDEFIEFLREGESSSFYRFDLVTTKSFYRWSKSPTCITNMTIQNDLVAFFTRKGIDAAAIAAKYNMFISPEEIRHHYKGLTFGNHTWSHPLMTLLDYEDQLEEVKKNHKWLQRHGVNTKLLAMPFTPFDSCTLAICNGLGYDSLFTVLNKSNVFGQTGRALTLHRWMAPATAAELSILL